MWQTSSHIGQRPYPAGQGRPLTGLPSRSCTSHIAHVQSRRRPTPQPEDSEQPRPIWRNPNDSLQLNPPKIRPVTNTPQNNVTLDWRSYRAKLVMMERSGLLAPGRSSPIPYAFSSSSWAHELPAPEVGCLLVAKQKGMDFFDRSVVLLAAHDAGHGSVGFVLNKPSPMKMCEVQLSSTAQGILDTFGNRRLQLGGPIHMETLTLLHAFSGLQGAQKVSEGVYYGGLPAAVEIVRAGLATPDDFTLMLGMTGWAPKQLDQEIAAGCWYVVAAGVDLLLPHKQQQQHQQRRPHGTKDTAAAGGSDALWRQVLHTIGRPVRAL